MSLIDNQQQAFAQEIVNAVTTIISKHTNTTQGKVPHNTPFNKPLVLALNSLLMPAMVRMVHRPDAPNEQMQQRCYELSDLVWRMVGFDTDEAALVCMKLTDPDTLKEYPCPQSSLKS